MVIGITGGIACGKSLITNYLIKNKYEVIDSDIISHDVLLLDDVKDELVSAFGEDILTDDRINRKLLGNIIFQDAEKRTILESIVFPYIQKEIKRQINEKNEKNNLVFLDAPLLLEYNLEYLVDKIIVVKVDNETQIQRLMARDNITYKYAKAKISSQWPIEEKEKYANFVIDNSGNREHTLNQLKEILKIVEE